METPPRAWGRLDYPLNQFFSGGNTPRAWGRPDQESAGRKERRNTPTGVGKTLNSMQTGWYPQKHPHGRGEDELTSLDGEQTVETPPRAWGRRPIFQHTNACTRNTPTGVGKTGALSFTTSSA